MGKQDDWVRVTLRLPPDLHEKLTRAAEATSLNGEAVLRLEKSFENQGSGPDVDALKTIIRQVVKEVMREKGTRK